MRQLLKWLKNGLAFTITILVGIGFGYLYYAAETLHEKWKPRHHSLAKHTTDGR
jgi:hypothetical protein